MRLAGMKKNSTSPAVRLGPHLVPFEQALQFAIDRDEAGARSEAVAVLRALLEANPHDPRVHLNLGITLNALGQRRDAIASLRRALKLRPDYPDAHSSLGIALAGEGELAAAEACYRRALKIDPGFAQARNNLGLALHYQGKLEEAEAEFRRVLERLPNSAEAHTNLGNTLHHLGRHAEASASHRRALELRQDFPEALNNLGSSLTALGETDEAIACLRRAVEILPAYAEAHNNLGAALQAGGHFIEAAASFHRALEAQPHFAGALSNLGSMLLAQGDTGEAIACWRKALQIDASCAATHSNLLLALQYRTDNTPQEALDEARRFARRFEAPLRPTWPRHARRAWTGRRLRVGYVSGDFREHSVAGFIEPVLASHDQRAFEVFCYATVTTEDAMTARLRAHPAQWRNLSGVSDAEAARAIMDERIDILVDLSGHTAHNRLLLFARKPAPVQASWLGYLGTTGLEAMDYRICDNYTDPPGASEAVHTEKLARMPDSLWCHAPYPDLPPPSGLPLLRNGFATFGSFNGMAKLNDRVIGLWARILTAVPGSRLVIAGVPAGVGENLRARLAVRGAENIELLPRLPYRAYLESIREVDVALDPFPYNGGTTSLDVLVMGVPLVTLAGDRSVGRGGVSILSNLGLAELVAATEDAYADIAHRLVAEPDALAALRASLRARMQSSPLMDGTRFTRNLEQLYLAMWRQWCRGGSLG
jgi:protein O-GlcNAc transferase